MFINITGIKCQTKKTADKVNYYDFTGMIKHGDKYIYYSIPDVRTVDEWFECILIRTAKHDTDWTGGSNHYTSLDDFGKNVKKLVK